MTYQFTDETYLESFVESISSSLPNEIKRNLEHLHSLDTDSNALLEEWRDRQDGCLNNVEQILVNVFRREAMGDDVASIAATLTSTMSSPNGEKKDAKKRLPSPERDRAKVACVKCRARKTRCDGTQIYCLNKHLYIIDSSCGIGSPASSPVNKKQKLANYSDNGGINELLSPTSQKQLTSYLIKRGPPTSSEIQTAITTHNPQYHAQCDEITNMYKTIQQYTNEKVETAQQVKSLIDMALGRLNRDLSKFEKEFNIDPSSVNVGTVLELGGRGGMGGVGMMSAGGGVQSLGRRQQVALMEMVPSAVASSTTAPMATAVSSFHRSSATALPNPPPPPSSNAAVMSHHQQQLYPSMRGTMTPPPKSVQSANLAAILVTPTSTDWILAKILSYDNKIYTLSDEDVMSNQIYKLPEGKQVIPLKGTERNKWARGDQCYAVYPDTTSFYRATVSTPSFNGFVMVKFKDDWGADGVTQEKAILLQHVMRIPRRK